MNDCMSDIPVVEVYKKFINGEIKRIPECIFNHRQNVQKIMLYLIEDKYNLSETKFQSQFGLKFLRDNKLRVLSKKYSLWEIIEITYPNKFKIWEFNILKKEFYKENVQLIMDWLIKEKLNIPEEDFDRECILKVYEEPVFNKLLCHNNKTPYQLINMVYVNKLDKSDFKNII